jgi:oxygen-dependent protoporphyrinogen oxidase
MAPQLPEQALVSLLRQCYFTPRCRASAIPRQTLFNSSQRALHTPHSPLHPRHRQPYVRAQSRSSCSNKIIADARSASLCTKSAGLGHSEIVQYSPSAALGERPIDDYGRQQQSKKQQVAVLGGGITGLAAAHYLSRELSNAQITVYEGSERLGGWLNSTQVDVGNGHITLEQGPRTLRPHTPASLVTLEMACNNLYLEVNVHTANVQTRSNISNSRTNSL